jgi:hypothetical protein
VNSEKGDERQQCLARFAQDYCEWRMPERHLHRNAECSQRHRYQRELLRCPGLRGGKVAPRVVAINSINRNLEGRMGIDYTPAERERLAVRTGFPPIRAGKTP